jgi:hypothetical protein
VLAPVLLAVGAIAGGLAVLVARQPGEFLVRRTATMAAAPPAVFAQVNDFRRWDAWNPWARIDPAMTQTYEGAPAGVGAIYTWAGNNEVGQGRMTIVESRPSDVIRIAMDFVKPLAGTSVAEFTFTPEGDRTIVTWSMRGEKSFVAKAIHLVMNMDRMIGGQFDKGLAALKSVVEASPAR